MGPECSGGKRGETPIVGYADDLDKGNTGSFLRAGRLQGLCAADGVEIQKGLAALADLRRDGQISRYYETAAGRAYAAAAGPGCDREAPFVERTPFGTPLAPKAMARAYRGRTGEDVGPSVDQACRCTPREPDAIDPVSGWLIYYVPGGVLLTPSKKCIGGGGRPLGFWAQTWRNVKALLPAPEPIPPIVAPAPPAPGAPAPAPTIPPISPPIRKTYLCLDYRVVPVYWRPQDHPCTAPQISHPENPA